MGGRGGWEAIGDASFRLCFHVNKEAQMCVVCVNLSAVNMLCPEVVREDCVSLEGVHIVTVI